MVCSVYGLLWVHNKDFLKQYFVNERQWINWVSKRYPELGSLFVRLPSKYEDYIQATRKKIRV